MSATSTRPQWIDSHAHLDHEYPVPLSTLLDRARHAGVVQFITIGTQPSDLDRHRLIAEAEPDVFFSVGVHPHEAIQFDAKAEAKIESLTDHPKCVAVGEIGLDFHYDHSPREVQISVLRRQLSLAAHTKKPVVIHSREAEPELLTELKQYVKACSRAEGPGVIHCFSGSPEFAKECLALGFFLSFSGIVTFKNADVLRSIARETPLDRILVETDAPFLAPVPHRGKVNQSEYLVETALAIAKLRAIAPAELSRATLENTRRLFQLP